MTAQQSFYVTAIRDGKTGWLFGPVADHAVALSLVPVVSALARNIDPWCAFDAFGTTGVTPAPGKALPPGKLNDHFDKLNADCY